MQYRHHLPLTRSLVLTLPTSLPLLHPRALLPLGPSILEARLTISSPTNSASLLHHQRTLAIHRLHKRHSCHTRIRLTPLRHQEDRIIHILHRPLREHKQCTTSDRFQTTFRRPTFQVPPILQFRTPKMRLL